jgi:putative Mg2+ transporter-C (MgtC) family protein
VSFCRMSTPACRGHRRLEPTLRQFAEIRVAMNAARITPQECQHCRSGIAVAQEPMKVNRAFAGKVDGMGGNVSDIEMLLRAVFAMLGAGALGWERERYGKPAGLRTQMMVGLGSAMFTIMSLRLYHASLQDGSSGQFDLLRTIAGIVGGIGFLGAGTIIQAQGSVKGITTASTIWVVGGFGIACGLGYYLLAGTTLLLALTILVVFGRLEERFLRSAEDQPSSKDTLPQEDGERPS